MSKRVEETPAQQEGETRPRHIRIGLMGPIGAGKSTLAKLLGEVWGVTPVEEDFGKNPYLDDFYESPKQFSFKSQTWFLTRKVDQLGSLSSEFTEIIDPTLEMDYLYARVQYELGWMSDDEWKTYQVLYDTETQATEIRTPDVFIVVNAPADILAQRIRKRGREFELKMLDEKPEYFEKLSSKVSSWTWDKSDSNAIIPVDSNEIDYANRVHHQDMVVDYVEDLLVHLLERKMDYKATDGALLKLPNL